MHAKLIRAGFIALAFLASSARCNSLDPGKDNAAEKKKRGLRNKRGKGNKAGKSKASKSGRPSRGGEESEPGATTATTSATTATGTAATTAATTSGSCAFCPGGLTNLFAAPFASGRTCGEVAEFLAGLSSSDPNCDDAMAYERDCCGDDSGGGGGGGGIFGGSYGSGDCTAQGYPYNSGRDRCCRTNEASGTSIHDNDFYINFHHDTLHEPKGVSCQACTDQNIIRAGDGHVAGDATDGQPFCFPVTCKLERYCDGWWCNEHSRVVVNIKAGRKHSANIVDGFLKAASQYHMLFLGTNNHWQEILAATLVVASVVATGGYAGVVYLGFLGAGVESGLGASAIGSIMLEEAGSFAAATGEETLAVFFGLLRRRQLGSSQGRLGASMSHKESNLDDSLETTEPGTDGAMASRELEDFDRGLNFWAAVDIKFDWGNSQSTTIRNVMIGQFPHNTHWGLGQENAWTFASTDCATDAGGRYLCGPNPEVAKKDMQVWVGDSNKSIWMGKIN